MFPRPHTHTGALPARLRRSALCLTLSLLLAALSGHTGAAAKDIPDFTDYDTLQFAQDYSLLCINQERDKAGAPPLRLDPLAAQAAKLHADDMLARGYFSHWDPDGLKPTRRFNLLGGYHALGENIYFAHGDPDSAEEMIDAEMRTLMASPGHRRTILDPAYTHVGLGFSLGSGRGDFYADQEFITRVGGEYTCPLAAKVGQRVQFSGRYDAQRYTLEHIIVGYEERPVPRSTRWLANTGSYSDAQKMIAGYSADPRISYPGMDSYHDLQVDAANGRFRCQALLDFKGHEGLYYLFLWLKDRRSGKTFIAATATVDVTQ
jgi:uncharacterized protein YkwD